jgi:hypothetical protein
MLTKLPGWLLLRLPYQPVVNFSTGTIRGECGRHAARLQPSS